MLELSDTNLDSSKFVSFLEGSYPTVVVVKYPINCLYDLTILIVVYSLPTTMPLALLVHFTRVHHIFV